MTEWTDWHETHANKIQTSTGKGCWVWTACKVNGYGRVRLNGETAPAHRASYTAANGEIPRGLVVRHLCHNPSCVRPSHLATGTRAENAMDSAVIFGLTGKVSRHQVISIRREYKAGKSLKDIAEKHNIAFGTVYPIVCGKSYAHVTEEAPVAAMRVKPKMTRALFLDIRSLLAQGKTHSEISELVGVAPSAVSHVKNGTRYQGIIAAIEEMELDF